MVSPVATRFGSIEAIPSRLQPKKVWKHFHDTAEHWERLVDRDLTPLRAEAEDAVGVRRYDQIELPELSGKTKLRAHAILCRHHEERYGPIYLTELSSTDTLWAETIDTSHRQCALTPRSVYVIVQLDDPSWVVTAFRSRPATRDIEWEEEDFRRYGLQCLSREDAMNRDGLKRLTVEALRQVVERAPATVRDVWWLASAVGRGRVLAGDADVRVLLVLGEAALLTLSPRLRIELAGALDWAGTRQQLASGIEDDRPEDFERALADAEDLLSVADAIAEDAAAKDLCDYVASLLALRPTAWAHVVERANVLLERADDRTRPIARLWGSVANVPANDPLFSRWRSQLARLLTSGTEGIQRWVRRSMDGIAVAAPAPALGPQPSAPWHIRGVPAAGALHYRLFVVDEANPDGYDVTAYFTTGDGTLWHIDRHDDRALLVIVAGDEAITGRSLDEVLAEAEQRGDVHASVRVFSPPTR